MEEKLGKGGEGPEPYNVETGQYVSKSEENKSGTEVEEESKGPPSIKSLNLKIQSKDDLEKASQAIIESHPEEIINKVKNLCGQGWVEEILTNAKKTKKEKRDDNAGIDYYLINTTKKRSVGLDDKTGCNTTAFSFQIYKVVEGKELNGWFTNRNKRNELVSFSNLKTDDDNNVIGCEYDIFDQSCLMDNVYKCIGLMNPDINPDSFLFGIGRKYCNKYEGKDAKFKYRGEGIYLKIKNKYDKVKGHTISVTLEIDKDKLRSMFEKDEYQFLDLE